MYRIYSQINGEKAVGLDEYYDSFSEANRTMRHMAALQAQKMGVESYISAIREGKYKSYRKYVADGLTHVFLKDSPLSPKKIRRLKDVIEDFEDECKEYPDDFWASEQAGEFLCFDFYFAQGLHLEFQIDYYSCDDILGNYVFLKDKTGSYKFMIEEEYKPETEDLKKVSNSANILLVYKELLNRSINTKLDLDNGSERSGQFLRGTTAKQISESPLVLSIKDKSLLEETVVNHINALKNLGIPIITYKFSKREAQYWAVRGVRNNYRYEIDLDFLDKVPDPIDASKLKAHVNPLLVLFVLKTSTKPMRQDDIARAIEEKYKVKLNRQAVSRNIKLLLEVNEPIKKNSKGYAFENEE